MLNLLTIDFNSDAPAKMGTEPTRIFTLPFPKTPPQTLSGNTALVLFIFDVGNSGTIKSNEIQMRLKENHEV